MNENKRMNENNNQLTNSKFSRILFNQISFVLAVMALASGSFGVYKYLDSPTHKFDLQIQELKMTSNNLEKKMEELKVNEIKHINEQLTAIQKDVLNLQKEVLKLGIYLEKALTPKGDKVYYENLQKQVETNVP